MSRLGPQDWLLQHAVLQISRGLGPVSTQMVLHSNASAATMNIARKVIASCSLTSGIHNDAALRTPAPGSDVHLKPGRPVAFHAPWSAWGSKFRL